MANTTIMFNPNSDMDRAVHPLRNFLEDEFIAFQISNATWGKLGIGIENSNSIATGVQIISISLTIILLSLFIVTYKIKE